MDLDMGASSTTFAARDGDDVAHMRLAMRAPSAIASSFAHMIDGCTRRLDFFLREAAVGAGNQILAADARGEPRETFGDELRMFHQVRAQSEDSAVA